MSVEARELAVTLASPSNDSKLTAEQIEANRRAREVIDAVKTAMSKYSDTARMLLEVFEDGTVEHMTYADGRPVPPKKQQQYFATAFGCDQSYISRMIQHGRIVKEFYALGIELLPERTSREFSKLRDRKQLPEAVRLARKIAYEEHESKGWRGDPKIKSKHAKKAVETIQGTPPKRENAKAIDPTQDHLAATDAPCSPLTAADSHDDEQQLIVSTDPLERIVTLLAYIDTALDHYGRKAKWNAMRAAWREFQKHAAGALNNRDHFQGRLL